MVDEKAITASCKVLFALTGDVRRNSRALKQLRLLSELQITVDVLHLGGDGMQGLPHGVRAWHVPQPRGSGPRFFAAVHRRFNEAARQYAAHVYHASDLYVLPALCASARKHGGKVVYDIRELYPSVASTVGRPWVRAFWRLVEGRFIRRADATLTVGEQIADVVARTYNVRPPAVVHNVPPAAKIISSDLLAQVRKEGRVLLLHQGNMQKYRGNELLLQAMIHIKGAQLVFLGGGPLKQRIQATARSLRLDDKVLFVNPVPPNQLLNVTAEADIGISLLEDVCLNHRLALPNKLFEYLMAGVPVLVSRMPEMTKIVQRFNVGQTVDPTQPHELIGTLQSMIDNSDARAAWRRNTSAVFETYNWQVASDAFRRVYAQVLPL